MKSVVKNPRTGRAPRKVIAFGWYGGKYSHLDWLLPLLPESHHYCEPFGGSAAVLLNRPSSAVETYNDLDGEVVNFFRVLRAKKDQLIEAIGLTPFSREEFQLAIQPGTVELSDLEKARRFYVRARQVRTGLAQTASIGRWANCLNTSRAGMSGAVSRWLGGIDDLAYIANRLLRVQIENDDALSVIQRYDSNDTLFYCDPPYPHGTRGDSKAYSYEMTDSQHEDLAILLRTLKGKVALSTYRNAFTDNLYQGWRRVDGQEKTIHSVKELRREVLYCNFDTIDESGQARMLLDGANKRKYGPKTKRRTKTTQD
jgi:DNA adenine methylase